MDIGVKLCISLNDISYLKYYKSHSLHESHNCYVYVELLSELNLSQVRKVGDVLSFFVIFQMYSPMMHHVWGAVGWSLPDLCPMLLPCQPCQLLRWSLTHLKDRSCHTADQWPADQCQNIQDQWGWEIPSKLEWIVLPAALCKMYFQILSWILHFLPSVRDVSREKRENVGI